MNQRVVILLDGGFVKKKLRERLNRFPTTTDAVGLATGLMTRPRLQGQDLFRVYFYDAPPFEGSATNSISRTPLNFSATPEATKNRALLDSLELQPDFAVRRGVIMQTGWKLGRAALKSLSRAQRPIAAADLVPDMAQKGVDIRIGLDIAWIAIKGLADVLVLVTGDSDFVPAMKFARKKGLRVYLDAMGHGIRRELKAHADLVL